ncbi:hypothetical protein ACFL1K_04285 [Candidatus Omnitrophota bacterium]
MLSKSRGQSTLEYAIIVVVVVAALIGIRYYMQRGVMGKLRDSADDIGEQYSAGITNTTILTDQMTPQVSIERFGRDRENRTAPGTSVYEVTYPAQIRRNVTEEVDTELADESLF